jgi:hypothetical protein
MVENLIGLWGFFYAASIIDLKAYIKLLLMKGCVSFFCTREEGGKIEGKKRRRERHTTVALVWRHRKVGL